MTGSVALRDHDWFRKRWLLDIARGELTPLDQQPTHGWVVLGLSRVDVPQATTFLALYSDEGSLWLQSGTDRWPVRELVAERSVSEDFSRVRGRLRWRASGQQVALFAYPNPLDDPVVRSDPTFDWIDAEAADFFLYLTHTVTNTPDWADRAAEHWRIGMR